MDAWGVAMIVSSLAVVVHDAAGQRAFLLVIAIGVMYLFAYGLNDYFDAPHDAQDPKKLRTNPFASGLVTRRQATMAMALVLAGLAIVFAYLSMLALAALLLFLFVAWAYSAPPLRLKSRPGLDILTHGLFVQTYPYWITALVLGERWLAIDTLLVLLNFLASTSGQLDQQIRDYEVDRRTDRNFTTTVGPRVSMIAMVIATLGTVLAALTVFGLGQAPKALLPFVLLPAPVFALRLISPRRSRPDVRLAPALAAIALGYALFLTLR
jgi:4-hydroxybenzoate polyprenyltransferase